MGASASKAALSVLEALELLKRRSGFLDAVVLSGGEFLLQEGVWDFVRELRLMGYMLKLDTNASRPDLLSPLLEGGLLDYVAVDLKAPLGDYGRLCGVSVDVRAIEETISILSRADVYVELRSTVMRPQLSRDELLEMAESARSLDEYVLQRFVPGRTLDPAFEAEPFSQEELFELRDEIRERGINCEVRS